MFVLYGRGRYWGGERILYVKICYGNSITFCLRNFLGGKNFSVTDIYLFVELLRMLLSCATSENGWF